MQPPAPPSYADLGIEKTQAMRWQLEALQLRKFGYTQQQIAETLKTPQQTVSYWLTAFGKGTNGDVGNGVGITDIRIGGVTNIPPAPITLYPCKYEEAWI